MSNKLNLREKREAVFHLLYQMSVRNDSEEDVKAVFEAAEEQYEMLADESVFEKVNAILAKTAEIDECIQRFSPSRAISRIAKINLVIMRIAIFEMQYDESVPDSVSINEAVELSKKYADKKDTAFINAVLDAYLKSTKKNG